MAVYCTGFFAHQSDPVSYFSYTTTSFWIFAALTYIAVLSDRRDPVSIRRLLHAIASETWRRAWEETPFWVASGGLAMLSAASVGLIIVVSGTTDFESEAFLLTLPACLLMMRDIGILYFFSLAANPKRAVATTLFYLAVLYGLLPMLMLAMDLTTARLLLVPMDSSKVEMSVVVAAIHAAIVWWLVIRRWHTAVAKQSERL